MSEIDTKVESLDQNNSEPSHDDILRDLNLDKKATTTIERNSNMNAATSSKLVIVFALVAVLAGVGTGFGAYKLQARSPGSSGPAGSNMQQVAGEAVNAGDIFGIKDDKTFKDSAEGYLTEAAADDEGSHLLLRAGGDTQTVHLTSSSTDLEKFKGMEIRVKGETFKGQKAGWLMDVGQVEVLKVQGEKPTEF